MLSIVTYPDKFLKTTANAVVNIDGTTQKLIEQMGIIMLQAKGVGLAAIQVGIDKSLLMYDITQDEKQSNLRVLINPKILGNEGETISEKEGCLSIPDFRANVKRSAKIFVEALDRHGNPLQFEADGFKAVVLQHEIDHLNGILFIDRISSLKRGLYKRKVKKQLKQTHKTK